MVPKFKETWGDFVSGQYDWQCSWMQNNKESPIKQDLTEQSTKSHKKNKKNKSKLYLYTLNFTFKLKVLNCRSLKKEV